MMILSLPLVMIPDNEDLLNFSSTLRVELEYLIYTIEQRRSITGQRYTRARERLAAGLVKFLNIAVLAPPKSTDSAIAVSGKPSESPNNESTLLTERESHPSGLQKC